MITISVTSFLLAVGVSLVIWRLLRRRRARAHEQGEQTADLWGRKFHLVPNGLQQSEVVEFVDQLLESERLSVERATLMGSLRKTSAELDSLLARTNRILGTTVEQNKSEAEAEKARVISEAQAVAENTKREALAASASAAEKVGRLLETAEGKAIAVQEAAKMRAQEAIANSKERVRSQVVRAVADIHTELMQELTAVVTELESVEVALPNALPSGFEEIQSSLTAEASRSEPLLSTPTQSSPSSEGEDEAPDQGGITEELGHPEPVEATEAPSEMQTPSTLYEGVVEVHLPQGVPAARVHEMHQYFRSQPDTKILAQGGREDAGSVFTLLLGRPIPLCDVLQHLPGVEQVQVEPAGVSNAGRGHRSAVDGEGATPRIKLLFAFDLASAEGRRQ